MKYLYLNIILIIAFAFLVFINSGRYAPLIYKDAKVDVNQERAGVSTLASGLDVPWEITWGPDEHIWITEQKGLVSRIDPKTGKKDVILKINDVWHLRTSGLLGMVLHSDMNNNPYVFLNYTFQKDKKYFSRLVRYTWQKDTLVQAKIFMEIPGNLGHNGSRLAFSQGKLYWATGDALSLVDSQDPRTPNGKILRFNIDGSVPADNPMKGNPVWAWGFRNIQGMVFSTSGQLYTSEHGDANDDEINLITKGGNYGWPAVQGFTESVAETSFKGLHRTVDPLKSWTPTIGPAGIDYYSSNSIPQWKNSLLLVSLKGRSLRAMKLSDDGKKIIGEEIFFENQYGRLRDLCISPAGDVYISTSNRDWNPSPGFPVQADDRILMVSKSTLTASKNPLNTNATGLSSASSAANLYIQYCASCHKENGMGLKGAFPALIASDLVLGSSDQLIGHVLKGSATIKGVKYDTPMPSFSFLKDQELADILSYVRSFGTNKASLINAEQVRRAR